ncbi:hypothetical protein AB4120_15025 [Cupriavidus sp. 2KB_3]|uniref:hypothetical protein n=1 Tax=Cupriavidus sp. 2KB_3 TaxID=3232980 RepID=UPI003F92B9B2
MDNNKIDPRAFQAETVYEQQMAGVVGAGPSMANEAASVAQMTDQIKTTWSSRLGYGITRQELEIVVHIIDALLAQAAPPAAPVQGDARELLQAVLDHDERICRALITQKIRTPDDASHQAAKQDQKSWDAVADRIRALLAAPGGEDKRWQWRYETLRALFPSAPSEQELDAAIDAALSREQPQGDSNG